MRKRLPLILLLVVQALGGGAITLAHARDAVAAPPGVEASHDARCAILHDEMRCALCHYAGARVVIQAAFIIATPAESLGFTPAEPIVSPAFVTRLTTPARAPPPLS
jgi:hypothetical protein